MAMLQFYISIGICHVLIFGLHLGTEIVLLTGSEGGSHLPTLVILLNDMSDQVLLDLGVFVHRISSYIEDAVREFQSLLVRLGLP